MIKELWTGKKLKQIIKEAEILENESNGKFANPYLHYVENICYLKSDDIDINCLYIVQDKDMKSYDFDGNNYLKEVKKINESSLSIYKYQVSNKNEEDRKEFYYDMYVKCNLGQDFEMKQIEMLEKEIISGKLKITSNYKNEKDKKILEDFENKYEILYKNNKSTENIKKGNKI